MVHWGWFVLSVMLSGSFGAVIMALFCAGKGWGYDE